MVPYPLQVDVPNFARATRYTVVVVEMLIRTGMMVMTESTVTSIVAFVPAPAQVHTPALFSGSVADVVLMPPER